MLRHLHAESEPVDMLDLVFSDERHVDGRPWILFNMVASVDGATAVGGGSTPLNDEDDRALFAALRAVPDLVLAGAGTIRAENYRPIKLDATRRRLREERGLTPVPRLAVTSGSLSLDPGLRVFSDPEYPPLLITGEDAPPDRVEKLSGLADIVKLPKLDAASIVGALGDARVVLCEGGPTLNGQLMAAGLYDEIDLTISPVLALGQSHRIASGDELNPPGDLRLDRVLVGDRSLFLRYVR